MANNENHEVNMILQTLNLATIENLSDYIEHASDFNTRMSRLQFRNLTLVDLANILAALNLFVASFPVSELPESTAEDLQSGYAVFNSLQRTVASIGAAIIGLLRSFNQNNQIN